MATIQGAINSMIGSASHAIMAVKGYQTLKTKQAATAAKAAEKAKTTQNMMSPQRTSPQEMAAQRAKQSATDAVTAKVKQRRNFMEYLKNQPSSLGKIGDLDPGLQKQIAKHYTKSMRQRIMDTADKEAKNGKHQ